MISPDDWYAWLVRGLLCMRCGAPFVHARVKVDRDLSTQYLHWLGVVRLAVPAPLAFATKFLPSWKRGGAPKALDEEVALLSGPRTAVEEEAAGAGANGSRYEADL
jgi:hypothetical protein